MQLILSSISPLYLGGMTPPVSVLVKLYCANISTAINASSHYDNINFGVRLLEEQGTYKASLNLFVPTSYLQPEQKEIKPIDLLELFARMLAALEKPYGSAAPQSNREQFKFAEL